MFGTEVSSDKHPNSKSYCPRDSILSSRHDAEKCPNEPKYSEHTRDSFGLERRESEDEGIVEIVPDSRSCREHIADDREEKIPKKSDIPSSDRYFFGSRLFANKRYKSQCQHTESTSKIDNRI